MSTATNLFLEEARGVSVIDGYRAAGGGLREARGRSEIVGSCLHDSSTTDAFSINPAKNVWNCRRCGYGGRDGLSIIAHELGHDLKTRAGLMEACAVATGKPIPDGEDSESDDERAGRKARLAKLKADNERAAEARERDQTTFRERERGKAAGIYEGAAPLATAAMGEGRSYLGRRGAAVPDAAWLRVAPAVTYWHGQDERGFARDLHCGPAMIAPFVDAAGALIGCHITWIDLSNAPKLRPAIGLDDNGRPLPTKKMRGTKKGGLIPLAGEMAARRWLGGEGIENTLAVARAEGFRADTFYFAAGDLGNLAGPARATSRLKHPTAVKPDKNGKDRPVMIAGPEPDPDRLDQGFPVGAHVEECVLVADGDSERIMTAAAMARARRRVQLLAPRALVPVLWPPAGVGDFAELMAPANEKKRAFA